jgi:hypothetical protein
MKPFDPALFQLGDIVELQVSFMAVQVRDRYRVKAILRSVALLDNSHSEVWLYSNLISGILSYNPCHRMHV